MTRAVQQRVLVVGASSGIGEATARLFADHGAAVGVIARREARLVALARDIDAISVIADVGDRQSIRSAVVAAATDLGGLDVLVNCAGRCMPLGLDDIDGTEWRQHLDVNLSGAFYASQVAAELMIHDGDGAIVNVSSELGIIGMPKFVAYCAAKAGLLGLTRAMAAELAPDVRVTAVCPGPVDTPMLHAEFAMTDDPASATVEGTQRVPLGRFAHPEEIANAIHFLANHRFATGTVMQLDGGTTNV